MNRAAGTVLIREDGKVLLRKPRGGYGGYSWTFAKGHINNDEAAEDAALRETAEELGWVACIEADLGDFVGSTTTTRFFLASPVMPSAEHVASCLAPDSETEDMRWVRRSVAELLIKQTVCRVGRARDLAVLEAAYEARELELPLAARRMWA